jgi:adenosine deaminase
MKELYDLGVKVTLNSDNMMITGYDKQEVTITNEINIAIDKLKFSFDEIKSMMRYAIEARFGEVD